MTMTAEILSVLRAATEPMNHHDLIRELELEPGRQTSSSVTGLLYTLEKKGVVKRVEDTSPVAFMLVSEQAGEEAQAAEEGRTPRKHKPRNHFPAAPPRDPPLAEVIGANNLTTAEIVQKLEAQGHVVEVVEAAPAPAEPVQINGLTDAEASATASVMGLSKRAPLSLAEALANFEATQPGVHHYRAAVECVRAIRAALGKGGEIQRAYEDGVEDGKETAWAKLATARAVAADDDDITLPRRTVRLLLAGVLSFGDELGDELRAAVIEATGVAA